MRRRLDLAASIVVTPELMFLDEPTTGLGPPIEESGLGNHPGARGRGHDDPPLHAVPGRGRPACRGHRRDRSRSRSSPRGRPLSSRRRSGRGPSTSGCSTRTSGVTPRRSSSREFSGVKLEPDPASLSVPCDDADRGAEAVAELARRGIGIAGFSLGQPSLDEVFLALTGRPAADGRSERRGGRSRMSDTRTGDAALEGLEERAITQGALLRAPPGAPERPVGGAHLRLAGDPEDQARPRAADRRDDDPGPLHADVHLHVRGRDLRLDGRVPPVHPAGHPDDVGAVHHRLLGSRPQHRPDEGRRRQVSLASDLASRAARGSRARRQRPLPGRGDRRHHRRRDPGLSPRRRLGRSRSRRLP